MPRLASFLSNQLILFVCYSVQEQNRSRRVVYMIEFRTEQNLLLSTYEPDVSNIKWVLNKFKDGEVASILKTFNIKKEDVYGDLDKVEEDGAITFVLGEIAGDYFKINREILSIDFDLFFHRGIPLKQEMFVAVKSVSIFKQLNEIYDGKKIYIGGESKDDNISIECFNELVKNFPNYYELRKYVQARINGLLKEELDISDNAEKKYQKYINKKGRDEGRIGESIIEVKLAEKETYRFMHNRLQEMLDDENEYNEGKWQDEILNIVQFIYPKYIRVFKKVKIQDCHTPKPRELDFLLIDANGHLDIIEIKKPFEDRMLSKSRYRDNHIPLRELSGTIMQVEKYIYYLNTWGITGEEELTEKYKSELPNNFKIKIVNPSGIIIMGRENTFSNEQKKDFEVIKRKYKNIVDIITYDELLNRLSVLSENIS